MNNNQRDPRWANLTLGFGTTTIGQSGCTISVIGDVLGLTPDVVNERLKAVSGFSGSLVIWNKLPEAFPGLSVKRIWTYDNTDVANNVPNVIVEVPAAPIGGTGSHWVNYIGDHYLKDPWTGAIRPTSDFPNPTGYCVLQPGKQTTTSEQSVTIDGEKFKELVGKASEDDEFHAKGFASPQETADKLARQEAVIDSLNATINDKNAQLAALQTQASSLATQVTELTSRVDSLTEQAKKVPGLEEQLSQALKDRSAAWEETDQVKKTMSQKLTAATSENARLIAQAPYAFLKWLLTVIQRKKGGEQA